jgi:hypothetical protein
MIPVINLLSEVKFRLPKIFVYFILIWFRKIVNIGKYRSEIREALTSADLDAARDQLIIPSTYHPDLIRLRDIHE